MSKKSKIISLVAVSLCVLLLIGSIVCTALMFTGDIVVNNKQDIVANAQIELDGQIYTDVPVDSFTLLQEFSFGVDEPDYLFGTSFIPTNDSTYFVSFSSQDLSLGGYLHCNDGYTDILIDDFYCDVLGTGSVFPVYGISEYNKYYFIPIAFLYDAEDDSYNFYFSDYDGVLTSNTFTLSIYSVPSSDTSNSTIDNIGSIIVSGMTFGLDGITSSVSTAFDSVFLDNDGNLSNYSVFVFWALGVSVALGFFKYILDWILSLGCRK